MKSKLILSILLYGLLLSSCHGDLNVIQKGAIATNSMWQDGDDAVSAMYGMFSKMRGTFSEGYIYWGEYRTGLWGDGLMGETSRTQVYQNKIPTNHGYADWTDLYTTINDANLILKYVPGIFFNEDGVEERVLASAYFVRAFCYYWIGRVWGDAPLLLEGFESDRQEGLYPVRQSADEIFRQVGEDVENALKLMPASVSGRNMVSAAAINMLKADYNLWMYKIRSGGDTALKNASTAIAEVLGNSTYTLEKDYSSIFSDKLGSEIIFAWSYLENEYTGGYPGDYLVPAQYTSTDVIENPVKVGSHQQWCFYTEEYKALLSGDARDKRTAVSFETYYDEKKKTTLQWINKFAGTWNNGTRVFDSDIIVYRYADAILFSAEIEMEKNKLPEAVGILNRIAERAYGVEDYYSSSLSREEIKEAIITERMKEFAAEGKLWWDYIRMGVVFEKVPYLVGREKEVNILLWPVSQTSINKNPNLNQTLGYDK